MKGLFDQPQCVQSSTPGEGNSPTPVAIVVDHRHRPALQLHHFPLHPWVLPAGPQADPLVKNFGFVEWRLQPTAALQDALSVSVVHLQPPVSFLPRPTYSDTAYAGVDVRRPISISNEVLHPGGLHFEDLASDRVHLCVSHQYFGAETGAVDNDIKVVTQFLKIVDFPLFHLTSSFSEPLEKNLWC